MGIQGIASPSLCNPNISISGCYINETLTADFKNILCSAAKKIENKGKVISAEQSLKTRYSGLNYQVLDASQFTYWNRLDFPVSKLFEKKIDSEFLKSWKPKYPTSSGYEPYVQQDLEKVPRGAYAVFIHPAVQKKMEQDPMYAEYIVQKIEKHFEKNVRINESISPGCTLGMSQAVSITENGEIGFEASVVDGPNAVIVDPKEPIEKNKKESLKFKDNSIKTSVPILSVHKAPSKQLVDNYMYMYAQIDIPKPKGKK